MRIRAAAAGDSILGVINLEMLGWDGDNDGLCAMEEPDIVHAVQIRNNMIEINNQYGINLNIFPDSPIADSDQAPFWYNGFDVILFDQYTWEGERNPYYHTVNDRVQYINKPYYLKMAKLALGTLAFLALNLNFDIIHRPIATVVPVQSTNTNLFIYTGKQIGAGSLAPRMYYRTKEFGGSYGGFNEVVGTSTGGGNYTFNIPVLPNGTFVQYYLAAQDENSTIVRTSPLGGGGFNPPGSIPPTTFYEFLVADLAVIKSDEANDTTNWTTTGGWNTTTEKYVSAPTSFTDSPGGNYPINSNATLTYNNQVQVLNAYKTFLEFDTQFSLEYAYEYAQVQITTNNGSTWIPLNGQYTILGRNTNNGTTFEHYYGGVQPTWVHEIMDISNYSSHPFNFRYLFKTDDMYYPMDGWYIDNVKVSVFASILGEQPSIDKSYARKDLDSVLFRIKLLDIYNHQFTSHVICANLNSTQSDSLTLLDDGLHGDSLSNDGVYAGYIPPRTAEGFYSLSLSTVDHQTNNYINSPDICRFTTAGPVVLDSIRFVKGLTNYYNLRPFVRNEGSTLTIPNAQIRILCNDPWVSAINTNVVALPAIAPGASVGAYSWKAVNYIDSIFPGYFNFKVEIESDGWVYWIDSIKVKVITGVEDEEEVMPSAFKLEQNFPNPFNPTTTIGFGLPEKGNVRLSVLNILGEEIRVLLNEEKEAGYYSIEFSARGGSTYGGNASSLPSGIYFYRIQTGNFIDTKKMILLK